MSLSPDTTSSSLGGGAQGVPRPAERHSPSSVSWAVPRASSRWDVPATPSEEGVQEASGIDARTTSTGSSRCEGAENERPEAIPQWAHHLQGDHEGPVQGGLGGR
ncbi:hypothetical protein ATANTOWER_024953 [Ataeniobius toweri]|uniref:Uncharacterized protein n=1 Tax=Ataeniobius toweri TaxID=208326 RepID=A0ABU7BUL0_9TELE|nr:hypothetical protein [Ataeniobius toweri]